MSNYTKEHISDLIKSKIGRIYAIDASEADAAQLYHATVAVLMDIKADLRARHAENVRRCGSKKIVYMCMEFLVGRSLPLDLEKLSLTDAFRDALGDLGFSFGEIASKERDPGLGNGGLGRLAACLLESLADLGYDALGNSILYEFGYFRQKIIDGEQIELPDEWLPEGEAWLIECPVGADSRRCIVRFGGRIRESWRGGKLDVEYDGYEEVEAIPYDMLIPGEGGRAVSTLRLWRARETTPFDLSLVENGQYSRAESDSDTVRMISKVLYPSDNHAQGKLLRLTQQYFLVSASMQRLVFDHVRACGSLDGFAEKHAVHLNDTHPALCIPELVRIFIDECGLGWDEAWGIVRSCVSYTNHTVMPEALEVWSEEMLRSRLPRIYSIICEINRRFVAELVRSGEQWQRIERMSIVGGGVVRMANLSVVGSHTVNGVSELHTEILRRTVFSDFDGYEPGKIICITNGIAHRRWLLGAGKALSALIDECIGQSWRRDPQRMNDFAAFASDASVIESMEKIKTANKIRFADFLRRERGIILDPGSIFDTQAKRMHEYKRQLLSLLRIIHLYGVLRDDPTADIPPQTFFFAAKAAPGYDMAKRILRLIYFLAADIERSQAARDRIKVCFIEDYGVSLAEMLIPATEISEQISLAGKEASGTGNMKFMINGALTVATRDGANVEMAGCVGEENIILFGMNALEVEKTRRDGYSPVSTAEGDARLTEVLDGLRSGFFGRSFEDIRQYLLYGSGVGDPYMCMADFDSFCAAHDRAEMIYRDRALWNAMSVRNVAAAGYFSADRCAREYAEKIWHTRPVTE